MSQPFGLSARGGLYTSLNQLEMLQQPGIASKLTNFEVDINGGYRRVNGFSIFGGGSSVRPNGSNKILGIKVYADGVIVCSGTGIFFSQDGTSWISISKQSVHSSGDNFTTFTGRTDLTRSDQNQTSFSLFEGISDYGEIIICDGSNKPYFFRMEGTGALATRTFFAGEVTVSGTVAPTVGTIHDKHLVVSGAEGAENTIFYSKTNDPDDFTGGGSGSIVLEDQVVGLASFRNDLVIFCKNSIFKLLNINDSSNITIQPVTKNVGCISASSIQEMGGNLLFLSPDGLRTVAGTARIGDVELGAVSRPIQSIIQTIADSVNTLTISSVVLRDNSQYRLFYNTNGTANSSAKGFIATLTNEGFQFSELQGIKATAITSDFASDGVEKTFHGDGDGYIYNHNIGNSYDYGGTPANITASYQTPNLDFGDVGTKKTMRYVRISVSPEGGIQPTLRVRYDYEDPLIAQPLDYILDSIPLPSLFGSGIFGTNVFGATPDPLVRQAIQGSGHTVSFIVTSSDQNAPFTINGLYVDYTPSGRR
tara:strand:- start:5067 stop:6671 length:1605 start_codon:yes stop_codon:yes gene_type:complete